MQLLIRLFGPEARAAGTGEARIEAPDRASCAQVRHELRTAYPALADSLEHARFAVNSEFADDSRVVGPGDEIALIGLVSGG